MVGRYYSQRLLSLHARCHVNLFFSNLLQGQQYHSFNEEGAKTVGRPLFSRTGANIGNDVASDKNIL